jgi:hypothetical protein
VFFEVFLVQIRRKLRKIYSEVCIQSKKNFRKRVPKFKTRGKNGNPGVKNHGGWEEKIASQEFITKKWTQSVGPKLHQEKKAQGVYFYL